jgi:ribosomal protein S18 acetylase RimI-like enzyme
MPDYDILPITEDHIESFCAAIGSVARERKYLAFLDTPALESSREFVLDNLNGDWPHFVAMSDGKVVGWCDISALDRPVFAHSGTLGMGVLAPYRGQGIGEALMRHALEKAKRLGLTRVQLHVREHNQAAIALYKKFGFVVEGLHRNAIRIDNEYENDISMALLFE